MAPQPASFSTVILLSLAQSGADQSDDLLGLRLSSRLEFGVDQFAVHGDFVRSAVIGNPLNGLNLVAEFFLQGFRYPSGQRTVVSIGAVADLDFHECLLAFLLEYAGFYHTPAWCASGNYGTSSVRRVLGSEELVACPRCAID